MDWSLKNGEIQEYKAGMYIIFDKAFPVIEPDIISWIKFGDFVPDKPEFLCFIGIKKSFDSPYWGHDFRIKEN